MSVYFAYRSHYEGPSGKHVRVLEADSVLAWFQGVWGRAKAAEDISEWLGAELGCDVYGFASLFEAARDELLPPPETDRTLGSYLEEHLYAEGGFLFEPHALQVLTNDDEIELAYYFFDDHYLKDHPGRAAYLLHDDWRLPKTSGEDSFAPDILVKELDPPGSGSGATYLAFLAFYDSGNLTDLDEWDGPCRINGVRVPQLSDYLANARPNEDWPFELKLIRSQLPPSPDLGVALEEAARFPILGVLGEMIHSGIGLGPREETRAEIDSIRDHLAGGRLTNDPTKSLISVGDHVAQLCLHTGWEGEMYHQWVIFDDLWAGRHPDLTEGVLRYAKRWDVLTA